MAVNRESGCDFTKTLSLPHYNRALANDDTVTVVLQCRLAIFVLFAFESKGLLRLHTPCKDIRQCSLRARLELISLLSAVVFLGLVPRIKHSSHHSYQDKV
jgi:hypothetical protein